MSTHHDAVTPGGSLPRTLLALHDRLFAWTAAQLDGWFIGLAARLVFTAVLLPYYFNSALTKLGPGLLGVLEPTAGAFAQIVPPIAERYGYDISAIPFVPWHLVVILGTVSEFVLPALIAVGLFTRWGALAMMVFIMVQTGVDIAFLGAAPGALFDTEPNELLDHRVLWMFVLLVLVMRGAGHVSADAWLRRRFGAR